MIDACNLKFLMERREHDTELAMEWYENNYKTK